MVCFSLFYSALQCVVLQLYKGVVFIFLISASSRLSKNETHPSILQHLLLDASFIFKIKNIGYHAILFVFFINLFILICFQKQVSTYTTKSGAFLSPFY